MSYRGNPALSPEVKQRILGTFGQTLDLAAAGSVHEATLGCDFILRMDPDFEPARTLVDRLEAAGGAVPVDDLRPATAGVGGAVEPSADELFDSLDDLDLHQPPSARMDRGALLAEIDQRFAARDFAGALELARGADSDPEVARRAAAARERQEAAPYVQRFLESARTAASTGDLAGARGHLDKAISLDPDHPGVRDFQRRLAAAGAVGAIAPPAAPGRTAPGPAAAGLAAARPAAAGPGDRIGQLLAEGQAAFDRGAYQDAIDSWSRIFLIDVDHAVASQRIEEARRLKAEQEREVEEVFHDALDRLEAGDRDGARRGLERVLEINPGHMAARERLDEIDRVPAAPAPAPRAAAAAGAAPARGRAFDADASGTGWDLRREILVPPEPGAARPAATSAAAPTVAAAAGRGRSRRLLLLAGGLVLVVAAAALAFLYLERDRFFPNAREPAPAAAASDPIARATDLHAEGKTQLAIGMLRRIPAGAPQYEEAQALITQWEASGGAEGEPVESEGPPVEDLALREQLLAEGRQAYADGEYLLAQERFDEAAEIAPLAEPETALRAETGELLKPVASQIALFRDGQYEYALPALWRLREESPGDPVIERLIVDSYYNLAVRDLQRGDTEQAAEKLREILKLRPDDPEATRHLRFAESYAQRDKDLLYRIYVKYLPTR